MFEWNWFGLGVLQLENYDGFKFAGESLPVSMVVQLCKRF